MSRRMLLEDNYSENGLMPVTDGLICWLDGRDGSGTDTIWKDRSGNENNFTLSGFTFDDENGWTGKNLKVNFGQYAIGEVLADVEHTIEVDLCAEGAINGGQSTFFYFGDGDASGRWREYVFREDAGRFQIMYNNTNYLYEKELKKYHITISATKSNFKLYLDSLEVIDRTTDNLMSDLTANFLLGCGRLIDRFSKARFNSLKIYNRALTEEEIQQNYLYEKSIERRNKSKTILKTGTLFNNTINRLKSETSNAITKIEFTKSAIPEDKIDNAKIVSDGNQEYVNCYAYVEDNAIYVSPEVEGCVIYANDDCQGMFLDQNTLTTVEFNNFNTSRVTTFQDFFRRCSSLTTVDLSGFDTSLNTSTNHMFAACTSLVQLNLSNFNTDNVIDMHAMFYNNSLLTELDLSSFNTSNVSNMETAFWLCGRIVTELTIRNSNIENFSKALYETSTSPNSKFVVKYIDEETKAMAEKIVATKSANSNVFLWEGPEDPVMDGLVCWLDGRDYVDNPGIWVDRSGNGNDFTLTSNTHWFDSNGVYFNGPDNSYASRELIGLSRNNLTFEIGYKMADNASSTLGLFALSDTSTSANNNSIFGYASYSEIRNTTMGKCRFNISKNVLYNNAFVCSEEQSTIYNNSDIVAQVSDINDIGNNLKLGGNKANGSNKLIIYYVRVYNRVLTQKEIKQNYLYEKSINRGE